MGFRRALLVLASALVTLGLSVLADRIVGATMPTSRSREGLIFPPGAALRYDLLECSFSVRINELGFRDREVGRTAPPGRVRVLVVGDSFTYGWGVELADSWVKRVETALLAQGLDVELLVLGAPGSHPEHYAELVERAVPLLQPDLVLVGLLQGDDLRQGDTPSARLGDQLESAGVVGHGIGRLAAREHTGLAATLWPHLLRLSSPPLPTVYTDPDVAWASLNLTWKRQAEVLLEQLGADQRQRYRQLPRSWREGFEDGRVPVWSVRRLFLEPANDPEELQLDSETTRRRIDLAAGHLTRLRVAAEAGGARVAVLSVPAAAYCHPARFTGLSDIGTEAELTSTVPDAAGAEACRRAGLEYHQVTEAFRALAAQQPLYYAVDAHFDPAGNRVYAELVTPVIAELLADLAAD